MNKSRLFALLLALAMVVSMFAGCGKDNTETPAPALMPPAPMPPLPPPMSPSPPPVRRSTAPT